MGPGAGVSVTDPDKGSYDRTQGADFVTAAGKQGPVTGVQVQGVMSAA